MLTGNKGEWSEIYTLFKLLGDKQLHPGDENLEKLQEVVYPILKILRSESNGNFEYSIQDDLVIISESEELARIPIHEFKSKAETLLNLIKGSSSSTFSSPPIEEFMERIGCLSIKASSTVKSDITIVIHDARTGEQPTLGFSIKSQLGNPSTLLNAGKTTNFVYKITGATFSEAEVTKINEISTKSKIMDRIKAIIDKSGSFSFVSTEKSIFGNNLVLIDSLLPEILSKVVLNFYSGNSNKVNELVENIQESNPLAFDVSNEHKFYSYKVKRFLTDVALGMMPSKVWTGEYDSTGGYLIVKSDGEILCYHLYDRNVFEEYLINNTKLETASSTRHEFGTLYEENGEYFFKLNLQIRFIK